MLGGGGMQSRTVLFIKKSWPGINVTVVKSLELFTDFFGLIHRWLSSSKVFKKELLSLQG